MTNGRPQATQLFGAVISDLFGYDEKLGYYALAPNQLKEQAKDNKPTLMPI